MKKLRANMDRYFDKLDERWQALQCASSTNIPCTFLWDIYCLPQV